MGKNKTVFLFFIGVLAVLLAGIPVTASTFPVINNVPMGGDVFIGEQNLIIPVPSGTVLSWYSESQVPGTSNPAATVTIGSNQSFYVAPSDFVGRTGNWYTGSSSQVAVVVKDPQQTVSIYDQQTGRDVTGKSVTEGDFLLFRIETSLSSIPAQRNSTAGFITIKVKKSDGTIYSSLYESPTVVQSLLNQAPDKTPYYWNNIPLVLGSEKGWATGYLGTQGERVYPSGGYTFWTESNLNGMMENYKDASGHDYTGKTVSAVRTITIASNTVKIEPSKDVVIRGNPLAVTVTGAPNRAYYLWVTNTSSMSGLAGDEPPYLVAGQGSVATDPAYGSFLIGSYQFKDGGGKTIQQDVPSFLGNESTGGTTYYALITLSNSGTRTVGFQTTKDTKDRKYTIRVERPEPFGPPSSDSGTDRKFFSDEVDVVVEKGAVFVAAEGSQSYFLGEVVRFLGANSETDYTYLFITGPNLPAKGGQMSSPGTAVNSSDPATFSPASVLEDNTWEYKWNTTNLALDAGTYTIYAVVTPSDKDHLANTEYATVSIIIRKPFISAQVSQPVIAAGDPLFISGEAAGQPVNGIAVWIFGRNSTAIYNISHVSADGTFGQEISRGTTAGLLSGQYFVVAQAPMYNGIFDVWPASSPGSINPDLVEGSYPVSGNVLFKIRGPGSLQGSDATEALIQALSDQSVDDTYTKIQFLVELPTITILPISEKHTGDRFNISGTTNLAAGDEILVEVNSSSLSKPNTTHTGEFIGSIGIVQVVKGNDGQNTWSYPMDTAGFRQDEYLVRVTGITVPAQASALFNIIGTKPTTIPTTKVTLTPTPTAATGKISVSSTPGNADIYLDGQDTGQNTPALLTGISKGKHMVVLKSAGYRDYSQNVTVTTGQTIMIRAVLTKVSVLIADFTVSPVNGTAPLTVQCTDASLGNPNRFVYDFGDGSTASGPDPAHTYRTPGVYTITLTVQKYNAISRSFTNSSVTKTNIITVYPGPSAPQLVAKFTASPRNGTAPLRVQFTDQSVGSPVAFTYDFGDGTRAISKNPVHTYRFPGVYNVTLTVLKHDSATGSVVSNVSVQHGLIVVT
jgi:PKD repeat protein